MSEQPKQEWRIEIAKMGVSCRIFCNGQELHPYSADLHLAAGQPSTLSLKFHEPFRSSMSIPEHPIYRDGDEIIAVGMPKITYMEMDGRRFRLMDVTHEGDVDDGLFAERRSTGDAHQSL